MNVTWARRALLSLLLAAVCDCEKRAPPRGGFDATVSTDCKSPGVDARFESAVDESSTSDDGASMMDAIDPHDVSDANRPDDRPVRRHEDPPPWASGTMMLPAPRSIPPVMREPLCFDTVPVMTPGFGDDSHSGCLVGDWLYFSVGGDVGRAHRVGSDAALLFPGDDGMLARVACGGSSFYLTISDIYSGAIAIVEFEDPARPGVLRWQRVLDLPSPERIFGGFASVTATDALIAWVWQETGGPYHLYVSGPHGERPRDLMIPFVRPPHHLHAWHDRLVFVSGGDIWLWTVGGDAPENLTNDDPDQWYPWIDGERIVWVDQRDNPRGDLWSPDNPEIYAFDLRTRTRTRITHDTARPALQHAPTLSGDWAVWMDFRNAMAPNPNEYFTDTMEIWGYNFRTGREYQIQRWGRSAFPLVSGNRLYFNCVSGVTQLVTRAMPPAD